MIIIELKGGLGNQLFQYAFGRFLTLTKNTDVKYRFSQNINDTQRQYKLDKFKINPSFSTEEEIRKVKPLGIISNIINLIRKKIFRQYNIGYSTRLSKRKNGYLDGFWQSYRYLEPIRDRLVTEITPEKPLDSKFDRVLGQIENVASVSVHIRRGDYVNDPKTKDAHFVCNLEYYHKAIDIIKAQVNNPTFFVFSDDIDWVSKNLEINSPTFLVSNLGGKDYEELTLMSKCKHNIIANSSFSFWGAWLNQNPDKIVIAPKKWSNRNQKEYKNLCPKNWIRI